ncbi:MAG: hypothetical protein KA200_00935 [Burkholderiales bacterium]|nr:hypothetical protein [Burkholderiales bacterium]
MPRYRHVYDPGHPLAYANGVLPEHRQVLHAKIGDVETTCHWCRKPIRWRPGESTAPDAIVADHLDNDSRNNSPDNLVPSCHGCNVMRSLPDRPLRDGELFITYGNGDRVRAEERRCEFCGAPFLTRKTASRPGWGRFCSRSCGRRGSFLDKPAPARRALTDDQVRAIRALAGTQSISAISRGFQVHRTTVSEVLAGKSYRHVQ